MLRPRQGNNTTNNNNRVESSSSYRDDPHAPPRLESFTYGGYGQANADHYPYNTTAKDDAKKAFPLHKKLLQSTLDVLTCQPCCGSNSVIAGYNNTNNTNDDNVL